MGYLAADITYSEKRTVFRGRSSRKTELRGTYNVRGQNILGYFRAKWTLLFIYYSTAANTVQISVQIYSDIVQLFVQ